MSKNESDATITDFGDQWTRFRDNSGYYGSSALFNDIVGGVFDLGRVRGRRVADIGSGSGRIVEMLLTAGAQHVIAVEPSRAYAVIEERFRDRRDRVTVLHQRGEAIGELGPLDLVFSIGVLHHIPDPSPVVQAAYKALKPGGQMVIWLYGVEGVEAYLLFARPLRAISKRLPDPLLRVLVRALDLPLPLYIGLCRYLPLPLQDYMLNFLAKVAPDKRRLIIFDQLNPAYAKYYSRVEAIKLLEDAGFRDVVVHHRHGYSWAAAGTKQ